MARTSAILLAHSSLVTHPLTSYQGQRVCTFDLAEVLFERMPHIRQKNDEENVVGDDRSKESTRPVLGWVEAQSIPNAQPRATPIVFNIWKT
jgi:hypothetical protein